MRERLSFCKVFAIFADELDEGGWCGMDIGAVERVGPLEQVGVRRWPGDVAPALGVDGTARMEDDSYSEGSSGQDRGMEEEDPEENEEGLDRAVAVNDGKQVDLIA